MLNQAYHTSPFPWLTTTHPHINRHLLQILIKGFISNNSPACPCHSRRERRQKHTTPLISNSSPACPCHSRRERRQKHTTPLISNSSPACPNPYNAPHIKQQPGLPKPIQRPSYQTAARHAQTRGRQKRRNKYYPPNPYNVRPWRLSAYTTSIAVTVLRLACSVYVTASRITFSINVFKTDRVSS